MPWNGFGNKRLALAACCLAASVSLSACAQFTDEPIITSSTPPRAPIDVASLPPPVPGESLEVRLARLEYDLAQLKLDYSVVRPSFETLVAREKDLGSRVAAMESAFGPVTAAVPAKPAKAPARLAPTSAAVLAAPPSTPTQPDSSAPFALHLASYKSRDRLVEGWQELKEGHPAELASLTVRIQRIDTGENGVFQRLIAGPVASRTAADGLCRTLSAQGVYCKTVTFKGDTL